MTQPSERLDGRRLDQILTAAWRDIGHDQLPPMHVTPWKTGGRSALYESRVLPGHDDTPVLALDRRCLYDGPKVVLATLLHAAVHTIIDPSFRVGERPPYYHTEAFRSTADLVGLHGKFQRDGHGWAATEPTDAALTHHRATLTLLEEVLACYARRDDHRRPASRARAARLLPFACACPSPQWIWASHRAADGPGIRCDGECKALFTPVAE